MFTVPVQFGFLAYLFVMAILLALAVVSEVVRGENHGWQLSEERLRTCSQCNLTFLVPRGVTVARCPRCHTVRPMSNR